jgi:hypothetical protein
MIEWQNVILTSSANKWANNCAIVTMKGGEGVNIQTDRKAPGTQPADVAAKPQLVIDGVNKRIVGNDAVLFTNAKDAIAKGGIADEEYNLVWTYNLLLEPTGNANEYKVVAAEQGIGEKPSFSTVEVTDNMILAAFHSDGTSGTDHFNRRDLAMSLGQGTILKSWEIDFAKPDTNYLNSCFYVEKAVQFVDPEADPVGFATIDGKVEKDGDVAVYEAGEEDRVLTVAEANLNNAYILIFNADNKLAKLGQNINTDVTLPAGYKAMTFFYNEDNQTNAPLQLLYQGAIDNFVTEEIEDNGMRTIGEDLGCPYAIFYDVTDDGQAEYWISKTAEGGDEGETSAPTVDNSSETESSAAASSEASEADKDGDEEGGMDIGLIIGIIAGVLVLAGAGVAVFFILKKKKA